MKTIREIWELLAPEFRPLGEWSGEAREAALLGSAVVLLFMAGGLLFG